MCLKCTVNCEHMLHGGDSVWAGGQEGIPVGSSGGTLYYNSAGAMPSGAKPVMKAGIDRCVLEPLL